MGCRSGPAFLSCITAQYPAGQRISRVTDAVPDVVPEWQSRAPDRMYPIVIFDALRVKIRDADSRMVENKAAYGALGRLPGRCLLESGPQDRTVLWMPESFVQDRNTL
ncbi:MAG: transposase [Rhodobacterales bacterium]|nr:transposase [Rhodobacterales bacterium]